MSTRLGSSREAAVDWRSPANQQQQFLRGSILPFNNTELRLPTWYLRSSLASFYSHPPPFIVFLVHHFSSLPSLFQPYSSSNRHTATMGDNNNNQATLPGNDPASHAPDAAAYDKGKGKAVEDMDVSMDEEEESEESDAEAMVEDEDEDGDSNLEPVSTENIISGGRRTRGKTIDYQEAANKIDADEMDDEEDDDEDFRPSDK
ncbi:histone chaperone domain CHZ-domain-containing protein [Aspergillus recurvatus]